MRHRSKTNSHPAEDLALRERYRRQWCSHDEAWRYVKQHFSEDVIRKEYGSFKGRIPQGDWIDASQVHHIFHSSARFDLWSNLIALHPETHTLLHKYPKEGTIINCYAKWRKSRSVDPADFNCAELSIASGKSMPSYLGVIEVSGQCAEWQAEMVADFANLGAA